MMNEKNLLYVNACVRENSRTNSLAQYLLSKYKGQIEELKLNNENISPLNKENLEKRDSLIQNKDYDNLIFKYAKQFASSDIIVIAAPFWDLSFPALLKTYFELINAQGVTFCYTEKGELQTLCKAKKMIYITTSGGKIFNDDYGFGYVRAISNLFYGIDNIKYFKAEELDIIGNNPDEILENAKKEIDKQILNDEDFR